MSKQSYQQFSKLNSLYKEIDDIYHGVSVQMGLSDSTLIILYGLCEAGHPCTQKELSDKWSIKKQTLRSSLNSLVQKEYVFLEPMPNNPHIKRIVLTQKGKELTQKTMIPLMNAEQIAFERLSDKERRDLLELTQKQVQYLQEETEKLLKNFTNREK